MYTGLVMRWPVIEGIAVGLLLHALVLPLPVVCVYAITARVDKLHIMLRDDESQQLVRRRQSCGQGRFQTTIVK